MHSCCFFFNNYCIQLLLILILELLGTPLSFTPEASTSLASPQFQLLLSLSQTCCHYKSMWKKARSVSVQCYLRLKKGALLTKAERCLWMVILYRSAKQALQGFAPLNPFVDVMATRLGECEQIQRNKDGPACPRLAV